MASGGVSQLGLLAVGGGVGVTFVVLGGMTLTTVYEEQERVQALSSPSAPPLPPSIPAPPKPPPSPPPPSPPPDA